MRTTGYPEGLHTTCSKSTYPLTYSHMGGDCHFDPSEGAGRRVLGNSCNLCVTTWGSEKQAFHWGKSILVSHNLKPPLI